MSKNTNLNKARQQKNDEFYTLYEDIEKELKHYIQHFKNKIIYCNCDVPGKSNFWNFFFINFNELGLKKLIATYYDPEHTVYKYEYDGSNIKKYPLHGNGDFRSEECIEILNESDVVITNPPFSLFREYVEQLLEYNKKFLIIGRCDAVNYKDFFEYVKNNLIWAGYNGVKNFKQPDGTFKSFGNICWWTNLDIPKRHEQVILWKTYKGNENNYPKYDNYDAINIDKIKDIPIDYFDIMGVPNTFTGNICPEQFEIIGYGQGESFLEIGGKGPSDKFVEDYYNSGGTGSISNKWPHVVMYKDGKPKIPYARVLIRRKTEC